MKKFILHIIYFSIALLAVLTLVDGVVTYIYHHKETRKYSVWNDILHTDIDADMLIMGNSRAWGQYSPYILDSILHVNSFNIGMDGSCFNRQKIRYNIYRHYQRRKPDYIIQNVEFFTLERTVGYEHEQFMPYILYPFFRNEIMKEEPISIAELYIPMYRYYKSNVYDDYTKYDFPQYKGYFVADEEWDSSQLMKTTPYYAIVDTATLRMFDNFMAQMQKENIQLILVMAPMYKAAINVVLNNDEICKLYKDLASKYDVPLLDYSEISICSDTTYFRNATHLNKRGAEFFSLQLARDLDSLGIVCTSK